MKYWCRQRLVITILSGPVGPGQVIVPRPFAVVGSHARADLRLTQDQQPDRAIYLHATDNGVYYRVLEMNVAHLPELKFMRLQPGDELEVGETRFQVRAELSPEMEFVVGQPHGDTTPLPVMLVARESEPAVSRRLFFAFQTLGSQSQCELELDSPGVSPCHCLLFWYQHHLWCVDFCSEMGTLLNGESIACSEMVPGDELEIGKHKVKFERLSQRKLAPPRPADATKTAPVVAIAPQSGPAAAPDPTNQPSSSFTFAGNSVSSEPSPAATALVPPPLPLSLAASVIETVSQVIPASFEPIQIQYGMTTSSVIQLESTPLGEQLTGRFDHLVAEQNELRSHWNHFATELGEWQEQLQADLASQSEYRRQAEEDQLRDSRERERLRAEIADLKSQLEESRQTTSRLQDELGSRWQQLELQREQQQTAARDEQQNTASLLDQLKAALADATTEREKLAAENARLAAQMPAWKTEQEQHNETLRDLAAQLQQRLAEVDAERQGHRQGWEKLSSEMTTAGQSFLAQWQSERNALSLQLTTRLAELTTEAASLRDLKARLETEHGRFVVEKKELAAHYQEMESQWQVELTRQNQERDQWRQQLAKIVAEQGIWQGSQSLLEARLESTLAEVRQQDRLHGDHIVGEIRDQLAGQQAELALQLDHLSTEHSQWKTELSQWQNELLAQVAAGNWRENWNHLQEEWAAHQAKFAQLDQTLAEHVQLSERERTEVKSQWQVVAGDMEQLSQSMKRKWKDLLRRQNESVARADDHAQRMGKLESGIALRHEELLALQNQVATAWDQLTQERATFRKQWFTLVQGMALLGRQLAGETVVTSVAPVDAAAGVNSALPVTMEGELTTSAAPAMVLGGELELGPMREQLTRLGTELEARRKDAEEIQSALVREMTQFIKERDATRLQWNQMTHSLNRLTQGYRSEVKRFREERKRLTAEHERVLQDKAAALEQLDRQSSQMANLQQELEQFRTNLHDQIQPLAD